MKTIIYFIMSIFFLAGCENPSVDDTEILVEILNEAVDVNDLQRRGGRGQESFYDPSQNKNYTGWAKLLHKNGQVNFLMCLKDGKPDGLATVWYDNGQKNAEGNYTDGKVVSIQGWKRNGEKCPRARMIDNKVATFHIYSENGTAYTSSILPNY